MEMWRKVTVAGLQETYLNLNNISQMSWNGVNTTVTLVNGKELHLKERPKDIFRPQQAMAALIDIED
jgi:uncharacterized protein YlzI (FlbEa/FlbD family)